MGRMNGASDRTKLTLAAALALESVQMTNEQFQAIETLEHNHDAAIKELVEIRELAGQGQQEMVAMRRHFEERLGAATSLVELARELATAVHEHRGHEVDDDTLREWKALAEDFLPPTETT